MRQLVTVVLLGALAAGCGMKARIKRLGDAEELHFQALRVYMDDKEERAFLRGKTEEERNAWLREAGLWERYYQYDEEDRDRIASGEVGIGFTEDMVLMTWGEPYQRRRMTARPASRSELFIYRMEIGRDGVVRVWTPGSRTEYKAIGRLQVELYVDDGVVTEKREKDTWD